MAVSKKSSPTKDKVLLRKKIAIILKKTFADLEAKVGEKKFEKNIEKASKVLASGAVKKATQDKKQLPKKK